MWRTLQDRSAFGSIREGRLRQESSCLLTRLKLERVLDGHTGCVNTVSFTPDGNQLLSGSDDLKIICWDWQTGRQVYSIDTDHHNNIFQARSVPHTNNRTLISCAADGQVRVTYLSEEGKVASSARLARHRGRAHKLSLVPDMPQCFLSSGEDGQVLMFDLRASRARRGSESGTTATSSQGTGQGPVAKMRVTEWGMGGAALEVDSVHHHPSRPWLFAVGGGDCVARVYDSRAWRTGASATTNTLPMAATLYPTSMHVDLQRDRSPHITCVMFSHTGELLATYHRDMIYLFDAQGAAGQGNTTTRASEDTSDPEGRADRKRKAAADGPSCCDDDDHVHQAAPRDDLMMLAPPGGRGAGGGGGGASTSHAAQGSGSADGGGAGPGGGGGGGGGRQDHVVQSYSGHRNELTVKGVSFLGAADEYVVSGSDCGHVFIWQKQSGRLLRVVHGDEHVVNCLEPHPWQPLVMATSGIEHTIKVWSPTAPPGQVQEEEEEVRRVVERNEQQRRQRRAQRAARFEVGPEQLMRLMASIGTPTQRATRGAGGSGGGGGAGQAAAQQAGDPEEAAEEMQQVVMTQLLHTAQTDPDGPAGALLRILYGANSDDDDTGPGDSDDEEEEEEEELPEWARSGSGSEDEEDDEDEEEEDDEDEEGERERGEGRLHGGGEGGDDRGVGKRRVLERRGVV